MDSRFTNGPVLVNLDHDNNPATMEKDRNKDRIDPGQTKWDKAGPDEATSRSGGVKGDGYNEGGTPQPNNMPHTGWDHSATTNEPLKKVDESELKGGTPAQGPTTGGMGAAGGGHDTDETDVWGDKERSSK